MSEAGRKSGRPKKGRRTSVTRKSSGLRWCRWEATPELVSQDRERVGWPKGCISQVTNTGISFARRSGGWQQCRPPFLLGRARAPSPRCGPSRTTRAMTLALLPCRLGVRVIIAAQRDQGRPRRKTAGSPIAPLTLELRPNPQSRVGACRWRRQSGRRKRRGAKELETCSRLPLWSWPLHRPRRPPHSHRARPGGRR